MTHLRALRNMSHWSCQARKTRKNFGSVTRPNLADKRRLQKLALLLQNWDASSSQPELVRRGRNQPVQTFLPDRFRYWLYFNSMDVVLEPQQAPEPLDQVHQHQAPEEGPEYVAVQDLWLGGPPANWLHPIAPAPAPPAPPVGPYYQDVFPDWNEWYSGAIRAWILTGSERLIKRDRGDVIKMPVLTYFRMDSTHPPDDMQIDVVRVSKVEENKQARDKHVLGLLTSLRAVFPGNVTESIGRQILPYAKYDVVPDELQLKQPTKFRKNIQYDKNKIQYDRKIKFSRKHQAPCQRR